MCSHRDVYLLVFLEGQRLGRLQDAVFVDRFDRDSHGLVPCNQGIALGVGRLLFVSVTKTSGANQSGYEITRLPGVYVGSPLSGSCRSAISYDISATWEIRRSSSEPSVFI